VIELGPFRLERRIGVGASAEVWGAVHREERVPVAVKVLTARAAQLEAFADGFRTEVQAATGLNHPAVVQLFDQGRIPPTVEGASGGRLKSGNPYLVMERLDGGSLHDRGTLDWRELRSTLLTLLDALAHAHARGVLHRDIKPGNIMFDADGQPKLVDFGIAHALEQDASDEGYLGTPTYMAPEQFEARWRDFGPGTDLYALGCTAWALIWGDPPFGRQAPVVELAVAHVHRDPPSLPMPSGMPGDLRDWLMQLLAKQPRDRFRCAADAAWALVTLPGTTLVETESPAKAAAILNWSNASLEKMSAGLDRAPMPRSWRRRDPPRRPRHLLGAGLGLYGLREGPIVGRPRERDRLWRALDRARQTGRPQGVVLRGPAGVGKSRLASWICRRATEVGAAHAMTATHGLRPGPGDGLGAMVARHLRCAGLDREGAEERIAGLLEERGEADPAEAAALAELAAPATVDERAQQTGLVQFTSPTERHVLVERLIASETRERPLVLWFDDVPWGGDAIALAIRLLTRTHEEPCPVLLVLTARDEDLVEQPAEAAALAQLAELPDVVDQHLGPLPKWARRTLVRDLLGLEGQLASRIEERSAGNPLFAVQMVRQLVDRDQLEPGRRGFRLRADADLELPEDLWRAWSDTIDQLLDRRPEDDGPALEVAALLGQEVLDAEWREACSRAGLAPAPDLLDALIDRRLARPLDEGSQAGWAFAHGMLREAMEQRARAAGRIEDLHLACAAMLRSRAGFVAAERAGRHLASGGRPAEALGPLLEGAIGRIQIGDLPEAEALLVRRDRAIGQLELDEDDERRGVGWFWWCKLELRRARLREASEWAEKAAEAARRFDWSRTLARIQRERGRLARHRGDLDGAMELLEEAATLAEALRDLETLSLVHRDIGDVHLDRGSLDEAWSWSQRALEGSRLVGDPITTATNVLELSTIALKRGDPARAEAIAAQARDLFQEIGYRWGVATALNTLAEAVRAQGQLDEAGELYRDALMRLDAIGDGHRVFVETNLGLLELERGRPGEALPVLRSALREFERQGRAQMQGITHAFLLPCLAWEGDWEQMELHLERAEQLLDRTAYTDSDAARMAWSAARAARNARQAELAERCFTLAAAQFRGLGHAPEAEAVEAEAKLGPP